MADVSRTSIVGFVLVLLGGLPVILGTGLFAGYSESHSSGIDLVEVSLGFAIGVALGGLIIISGFALIWEKHTYAAYALFAAGIEYSTIELYDGYGGGTPAFLIAGIIFFVLGFWYWSK